MKILKSIGAAILTVVFCFILQFNAAAALPQNKAYMSLVRDSGYYCLYNDTHKDKDALYMVRLDNVG